MLKAVDRSLVIEQVAIWEKRGGRTGEWLRGLPADEGTPARTTRRATRPAPARRARTRAR
jgi:hypothetical protein